MGTMIAERNSGRRKGYYRAFGALYIYSDDVSRRTVAVKVKVKVAKGSWEVGLCGWLGEVHLT